MIRLFVVTIFFGNILFIYAQYGMRSHPIYMGNPGPSSEPIPGPYLPVLPIVPRLSPYAVFRMPPIISAKPIPVVSNSLAPVKNQRLADTLEMSHFQTQDSDGRFIFGFNTADQSRVESRSADGTVRGSYSYTDPMGKQVQAQYWDTGAGFHITGNNIMSSDSGYIQDTPEVEAARNEHFQIYQQTLASLFDNKDNGHIVDDNQPKDDQRSDVSLQGNENEQVIASSDGSTSNSSVLGNTTSLPLPSSASITIISTTAKPANILSHDSDWKEQEYDDDSVIVDNPNLMRIAWSTDGSYKYAKKADSRDKKSMKMFGDRLVPLKSNVKRV
ncbi:uncharacterized protein LOC126895644 isoform X2 [Daktulosphaira vitifoliae]|uniref:uncharacterized protein LOC126895644 isoform X2 n=1 Tax=Daktulosphaira vitifoliae TaxID=58002 RepID=UPI0021AAA5C7|nr:uncharacterized protein LOC126895644 isoform X2 [Daktulosphaira vitifoliae]